MHTNFQVLLGTPLGTMEQLGEPLENLNLMGTRKHHVPPPFGHPHPHLQEPHPQEPI